MNLTRRSLVSLCVIVVSALALVGCGGDGSEARSDRPDRQAKEWYVLRRPRLCVTNKTGEPLTISFDDSTERLPLSFSGPACAVVSSEEMTYIRSDGGATLLSLVAANPSTDEPFIQWEHYVGGEARSRTRDSFAVNQTFVWGPFEDYPYRVTAKRLPDTDEFKEFDLVITR